MARRCSGSRVLYVPTQSVAEEVVADTWLAVVTGLERFEGRSSLKTWLFRILTNKAKTKGVRESGGRSRSRRLSATVTRRTPRSTPTGSRGTATGRLRHEECPEERLLAGEARAAIEESAIEALPANQRAVITLRDVEGLSAEEAVQRSRPVRDKSTCTAPSRHGRRTGPRSSGTWKRNSRLDGDEQEGGPGSVSQAARVLICQEIVEVITDYLEGAMDADCTRPSRRISQAARTARTTSSRYGR